MFCEQRTSASLTLSNPNLKYIVCTVHGLRGMHIIDVLLVITLSVLSILLTSTAGRSSRIPSTFQISKKKYSS